MMIPTSITLLPLNERDIALESKNGAVTRLPKGNELRYAVPAQ